MHKLAGATAYVVLRVPRAPVKEVKELQARYFQYALGLVAAACRVCPWGTRLHRLCRPA